MKSAVVSAILSAALLVPLGIAHPGQSHAEHAKEIQQRNQYLNTHKRSLAHCASTLKARGNDAAMHARRSAKVEQLRKKRSISQEKPYLRVRDLDEVLNKNHKSNLTGVSVDTDPAVLFAGNNSCILTPETTQGPYWVSGELIRQNIVEDQEGVPLTLDIQVIDVNTCQPVPKSYIEIWHCNSTGVYSGVSAGGNGNGANATDNLNNTFGRGIQLSDDLGVVTFETLFPGHYTGRATHIHTMSHLNATLLPNNTVGGGAISHVGQIFFDQSLISTVEETSVYASNTQELTTNADDGIMSGEADGYDPVVEYVLIGDDISEGVFAWIAFGMDGNAAYNISAAAYWTSNGGVVNPDAGSGGPGGPGGPPPSGSAPAAPTSTAS